MLARARKIGWYLAQGALAVAALVAGLFSSVPTVTAQTEDSSTILVTQALQVLSSSAAAGDLIPVLEGSGVQITFVPMAPGTYARFSVTRQTVEIDSRWSDADPMSLAAVLAHEGTHAQDAVSGYLSSGGSSSCIGSEIRAFRRTALFWLEIHGPQGKAEPLTDLERQLNLVAERQLHDPDNLEALVRSAYVDQCGPVAVNPPRA